MRTKRVLVNCTYAHKYMVMHAHSLASNQLLSLYNDIPCMDLLVTTTNCEPEDSDNLFNNILLQY